MGIETSAKRKKRMREARARQERRWAARSGPVTVSWVCGVCGVLVVVEGDPVSPRGLCSVCAAVAS